MEHSAVSIELPCHSSTVTFESKNVKSKHTVQMTVSLISRNTNWYPSLDLLFLCRHDIGLICFLKT